MTDVEDVEDADKSGEVEGLCDGRGEAELEALAVAVDTAEGLDGGLADTRGERDNEGLEDGEGVTHGEARAVRDGAGDIESGGDSEAFSEKVYRVDAVSDTAAEREAEMEPESLRERRADALAELQGLPRAEADALCAAVELARPALALPRAEALSDPLTRMLAVALPVKEPSRDVEGDPVPSLLLPLADEEGDRASEADALPLSDNVVAKEVVPSAEPLPLGVPRADALAVAPSSVALACTDSEAMGVALGRPENESRRLTEPAGDTEGEPEEDNVAPPPLELPDVVAVSRALSVES